MLEKNLVYFDIITFFLFMFMVFNFKHLKN